MLKIGLTGGIASGKSTVSKMIQKAGIPVIDADRYAHEVVEPGEKAYNGVIEHFGKGVLLADGTIDRKKLGDIIFYHPKERDVLNGIVHPTVREKINARMAAYRDKRRHAVVLDIPLLIEGGLGEIVDKVLLVYVSKTVQLERLMKRDGSTKEDALARIHSQVPLDEKRIYADAIIDNNGIREKTAKQLFEILKQWGLCI